MISVALIAAVGQNMELGGNNSLLWNMPRDMARFRALTDGAHVIMGRRTFESIGRPLRNRVNWVVTSNKELARDWRPCEGEGSLIVCPSMHHVLRRLDRIVSVEHKTRAFVIGGSSMYEDALTIADQMYLTRIEGSFAQADTFFPSYSEDEWFCSRDEHFTKDDKHAYDYRFQSFVRLRKPT